MYARILVEVDLAKLNTRRILVTLNAVDSDNEIKFFVKIEFENLLKYCEECRMVGHDVLGCKKAEKRSSGAHQLQGMRDQNRHEGE